MIVQNYTSTSQSRRNHPVGTMLLPWGLSESFHRTRNESVINTTTPCPRLLIYVYVFPSLILSLFPNMYLGSLNSFILVFPTCCSDYISTHWPHHLSSDQSGQSWRARALALKLQEYLLITVTPVHAFNHIITTLTVHKKYFRKYSCNWF